jgi:hypothetical protein
VEPALVLALILGRYGPLWRVVVQYHPYLFIGVPAHQFIDKPAYMRRLYAFRG